MDEVFAAIGAAMAETQGETLEQIDRLGDSAISAARHQVSITLQGYNPYQGADPDDAEWRYRKAGAGTAWAAGGAGRAAGLTPLAVKRAR